MQITKENIEYTQASLCSKICPKVYKACYLVGEGFTEEQKFHNIMGCPLWIAWRLKN